MPEELVCVPGQHRKLFVHRRDAGRLRCCTSAGRNGCQAHNFGTNLLFEFGDRGGCVNLDNLDRKICIGKVALQALAHFGLLLLIQGYAYVLEFHAAALRGGLVDVLLYLAAKLRAVAFVYSQLYSRAECYVITTLAG